MFNKYYTCDLKTLKGEELKAPSLTIGVSLFTSPCDVVRLIRNQLEEDGLYYHRIYNLRRIK